ncbi:hypothetical protein AB6N23_07660 [Cellulomonas sp. 179-A 9B4 NHS]|uniref:hypothetical protein n=1 Tax=Cellulomonas sp. 179-A 9B4 NHS TaxID=3142379 RepID=UPI0039A0CFD1
MTALAAAALTVGGAAEATAAGGPGVHVCTLANQGSFQVPRTYDGDLLVTEGCSVANAHVRGDVLVADAPTGWQEWSTVRNSRVDGDVHVDGSADIVDNVVAGGVYLRTATYATVTGTVAGDVRGTTLDLYVDADIGGDLDVRLPPAVDVRPDDIPPAAPRDDESVALRGTHVHGSVRVRGGWMSTAGSRVDGDLTLTGVAGIVLAETDVDGQVTVRDARAGVVLGGLRRSEEGPWEWLDDGLQRQSRYGALTVEQSSGHVAVEHVDVVGALACAGNANGVVVDPATTTVGGPRSGQCAG